MLAAEGYACERICHAPGGDVAWSERVVVVRSSMHATHQAAGLDKRLSHAETTLTALTPPRGRGKRHITDEATLVEAIDRVLTEHWVEGLLNVAWEKQVEQTTQYVGRGRGSVRREKRVLQNTRSHITRIARQADTIAARRQRCGWKAFVTNAGQERHHVWGHGVACGGWADTLLWDDDTRDGAACTRAWLLPRRSRSGKAPA